MSLFICVCLQGPCVVVDAAAMDFGLVAVGATSSQSLRLVNPSPCPITVHLSQLVVGDQEDTAVQGPGRTVGGQPLHSCTCEQVYMYTTSYICVLCSKLSKLKQNNIISCSDYCLHVHCFTHVSTPHKYPVNRIQTGISTLENQCSSHCYIMYITGCCTTFTQSPKTFPIIASLTDYVLYLNIDRVTL